MKLIIVSQINKESGWMDFFRSKKAPSRKEEIKKTHINPAIKDITDAVADLVSALQETKKQKSYQTGAWADPEHEKFWNDWETAFNSIKDTIIGVRELLKQAENTNVKKTSAYEAVTDDRIWGENAKKINFITDELLRNTAQNLYDARDKLILAYRDAQKNGKGISDEWYNGLYESMKKLEQSYKYLANANQHQLPN